MNQLLRKVIGIDLTGSEKRASGVAHLDGVWQAVSYRLKTDQEIIDKVKELVPDLVSIDSPLSLPEDKNKIYRDCELTLKRRSTHSQRSENHRRANLKRKLKVIKEEDG